MKSNETNTTPITPTEAHRSLVAKIVNYDHEAGSLLTWDDCAQFIADSEARACAAIHHELNEARNAERLARVQLDLARAERDEAELGKLQELHGCSQEMVVHWCEHAAKRSLELDFQVARNSDLFTQRDEAVEAQGKAEAELAAEREKVRVLREALDEAQNCGGLTGSIFLQARAALAATEGAK
jgi:hypothetical protein